MNHPKPANQRSTAPRKSAVATVSASIQGADAAMRRAAQRARQLALQTGTDLIQFHAGKVVRVSPHQNVTSKR